MARPVKPIDWDQFDKLCAIQCTQVEIANFFNVSVDTIQKAVKREKNTDYTEYYYQKSSLGRVSLRRKQFEAAMSGNITMLIWLGKTVLGQSEKIEHNHVSETPTKTLSKEEVVEIVKAARG